MSEAKRRHFAKLPPYPAPKWTQESAERHFNVAELDRRFGHHLPFDPLHFLYKGWEELIPIVRQVSRIIGMIIDGEFDAAERKAPFMERFCNLPNYLLEERNLVREINALHAHGHERLPRELQREIASFDASKRSIKQRITDIETYLHSAVEAEPAAAYGTASAVAPRRSVSAEGGRSARRGLIATSPDPFILGR